MSNQTKLLFGVLALWILALITAFYSAFSPVTSMQTEEEACKTQKYHCNQAEAFADIARIEREILGTKGAYQWYYHHDAGRKPASQASLVLRTAKDGSAHWSVK
jgi:hypothetical protein